MSDYNNIGVHVSWVAAVLPGRWHKTNNKKKKKKRQKKPLRAHIHPKGPKSKSAWQISSGRQQQQHTDRSHESRSLTHAAEFTKVSALPKARVGPGPTLLRGRTVFSNRSEIAQPSLRESLRFVFFAIAMNDSNSVPSFFFFFFNFLRNPREQMQEHVSF